MDGFGVLRFGFAAFWGSPRPVLGTASAIWDMKLGVGKCLVNATVRQGVQRSTVVTIGKFIGRVEIVRMGT